jgi:phosphoenolpyruvate-protein phosphotransferase (PTS system enzyme I)
MTIKAGEKLGKSVSVCGEMAGDAKLTKLLVGMGLRQLSMHPSHILSVKQQILHSQCSLLKTKSRKVLKQTDIDKIEPMVTKLNQISGLSANPNL